MIFFLNLGGAGGDFQCLLDVFIFKLSPVHKELQITFVWYHGFGFTNLCLHSYENISVTLSNTHNTHTHCWWQVSHNMLLWETVWFSLQDWF